MNKLLSLNDLCIGGGSYGLPASASTFHVEWPQYLRITDISDDGKIPLQLTTSVNPNIYKNFSNFVMKRGDIVFARTGNSTGRNYCLLDNRVIVYAGFLICFTPNPLLTFPGYIAYFCQSNAYRKTIQLYASGSTRKQFNAKQYGDLIKIPMKSLHEQQHIVGTTSSLQ